ncbi:hypothetical protein AB0C11_22690 [Streptomyces sp. NPDC039016]|uniref:hypothetical protein n=1 Tax=Streptomyces sp. NPDC039016 TaxID=3154330 RepID=UPI0034059D66
MAEEEVRPLPVGRSGDLADLSNQPSRAAPGANSVRNAAGSRTGTGRLPIGGVRRAVTDRPAPARSPVTMIVLAQLAPHDELTGHQIRHASNFLMMVVVEVLT